MCDNPGTLKSISNSSSWVNVCPNTGLPILVEFWVPSRPKKTSFPISWVNGCSPTGLTVLDNWVFGFGWIRWESLLLPATSESNSFIQLSLKKSLEEAEMTQRLSRF